jgi:hypothetical protein
MNELERNLVDTVVKLASARQIRAAQLRRLKALPARGTEAEELKRATNITRETIVQLQQRRKQLREELLKSRD